MTTCFFILLLFLSECVIDLVIRLVSSNSWMRTAEDRFLWKRRLMFNRGQINADDDGEASQLQISIVLSSKFNNLFLHGGSIK